MSPVVIKNDVWRSTDNGATWTQMNASAGWTARMCHSSVVMPDGSIVLMGGAINLAYKNDVWRSTDNGATWTQMTANAGWSARSNHGSVVMPDGSIILMGGTSGYGMKSGGQRTNGATWTQKTASAGWTTRWVSQQRGDAGRQHRADGWWQWRSGYKNDVWRSTDNGATWTQITANAGWPARMYHSSVVIPDGSIVLIGGQHLALQSEMYGVSLQQDHRYRIHRIHISPREPTRLHYRHTEPVDTAASRRQVISQLPLRSLTPMVMELLMQPTTVRWSLMPIRITTIPTPLEMPVMTMTIMMVSWTQLDTVLW